MESPDHETTTITPILHREDLVRKRTATIFSAMVLLLLVVTIRIAVMASTPPGNGRWRMFVIPSLRGRILDSDGRSLAWSTHQFSVTYRRPESDVEAWQDLRELQDVCGWKAVAMAETLKRATGSVVVLQKDIDPNVILEFQRSLYNHPRLKLVHGFKRHHWDSLDDRLAIWMGQTRQFGWREVGISGLEKKLNRDLLSGKDGKILVLIDDDGDWIPGTERRIQEPRPGFDRYVDFRIRQ
jgi:cell division protein FtsI/penicillin-binding protein 2